MKLFKQGFLYYLFATLMVGLLLMFYIVGDTVIESMDALGWLFYITSCISHAAIVVLALWLVLFLPWALLKWRQLAATLLVTGVSLLTMTTFLNMQVYKIYRFHLNGFILNMLTGPNAGDIFDFDWKLYLTEGLILFAIVALCIFGWWLCGSHGARLFDSDRNQKPVPMIPISFLLLTLLVANGCYVYGSFVVRPSIIKSARLVPYYFPLSASNFLEDLGFERKVLDVDVEAGGELCYPLHPLQTDTARAPRPNILMILIDSWSRRALTEETMPNLWQLAHEEQWYQNHVSCGNGTSFSVFGIFTGLQPYY